MTSRVLASHHSRAAVTYALAYAEAVKVAEAMGLTKTPPWLRGQQYSTSSPSQRLLALLEPHRLSEGRWWALVVGSGSAAQAVAADGGP